MLLHLQCSPGFVPGPVRKGPGIEATVQQQIVHVHTYIPHSQVSCIPAGTWYSRVAH